MGKRRCARLTPDQFVAISRALADPRRFAILQQIAQCGSSMPCSSLDAHEILSAATISHHVKELQEAGLIEIVREGRTASLSLCRETWEAYLQDLAKL